MYSEFLGAEYDVCEADDGWAGVALLEEQVPDLVVTDLSLPRMDGFELIRWIRAGERTASLPVIALSGYSGPEHAARAHAAGTTLVLQKPCSPDGLLDAIARLLERDGAGEAP